MQITQVDERTSSWEDSHPVFRVHFHRGFDDEGLASWTDSYDVTGADVLQVLDWAQRQAGDRLLYAVALVGQQDDEDPRHRLGLTWLVGMDGCSAPVDDAEQDVKTRMMRRRHQPVGIPAADRTPPGVPDVPALADQSHRRRG